MLNVTTEAVIEAVSEMSSHFYVVDSDEAAAALGAEIEALLTSTMCTLAAEHSRANANFGRAFQDLYLVVR